METPYNPSTMQKAYLTLISLAIVPDPLLSFRSRSRRRDFNQSVSGHPQSQGGKRRPADAVIY